MNFSVAQDDTDPSKVIESYTFVFEYHTDQATGQQSLSGVSLGRTTGETVLKRCIKGGLEPIIDRLIEYSMRLPELPGKFRAKRMSAQPLLIMTKEKRYLTCHVQYTNTCSPGVTLEGFRSSRADRICVPIGGDKWCWKQSNLGSWSSGAHLYVLNSASPERSIAYQYSLAISVGHVASKDTEAGEKIPFNIDYSRILSRFAMSHGNTKNARSSKTRTTHKGVLANTTKYVSRRPLDGGQETSTERRDGSLEVMQPVHGRVTSVSPVSLNIQSYY